MVLSLANHGSKLTVKPDEVLDWELESLVSYGVGENFSSLWSSLCRRAQIHTYLSHLDELLT